MSDARPLIARRGDVDEVRSTGRRGKRNIAMGTMPEPIDYGMRAKTPRTALLRYVGKRE